MKKKLMLLTFVPILLNVATISFAKKEEKKLFDFDKLKSNINFVNRNKNDLDINSGKIAILINEKEFTNLFNGNLINNANVNFLIDIIKELSPETEIKIYSFLDKDSYEKQINKIKEDKIKNLFHLYTIVDDKNEQINKNITSYLDRESKENGWINFFATSGNKYSAFYNMYNAILVNEISVKKENSQFVNLDYIEKSAIYENKEQAFKKTFPNIVVPVAGITNTNFSNLENSQLATAILIACFSKMMMNDDQSNHEIKGLQVINSILSSAKKSNMYTIKTFNNNYIYVGAGIFDFDEAWKTHFNGTNVAITKFAINDFIYEKEFELNKGDEFKSNLLWFNEFEYNWQKAMIENNINDKLILLFLNPVIWLTVEIADILSKIKSKMSDLDMVVEYFDGNWQEIYRSDSKTMNFEKISFKAIYSGKYRIRVFKHNETLEFHKPFALNMYIKKQNQ
ncbi:hypothetical protein [Mesomycoplasma lagogenitalium]|uniref:Uncharacterized protein n=1 Tax=Mesomycoplasma lagogenitalium TaxID=171286 RepID=A0ABY8LT77_9BACT|nr:hypothetical protein [Mesomycoplasma lagogenitalium]WGI36454.1 hypothetical protein QEG99_03245 [Mesomycoplasma lagogenitalium]